MSDFNLSEFVRGLTIPISAKGVKSSIYKEGIISKVDEDEAKKQRKKIRKICSSLLLDIAKNKTLQSIESFLKFYATVYVTNDFTVASVTTNINDEKREIYAKALEICKDFQSKKANNESAKGKKANNESAKGKK